MRIFYFKREYLFWLKNILYSRDAKASFFVSPKLVRLYSPRIKSHGSARVKVQVPSSTSVASQRAVACLIARRSRGVFPWHSPAVPASSIAAVTSDAPGQQRSPSRDTVAPRCTFHCANPFRVRPLVYIDTDVARPSRRLENRNSWQFLDGWGNNEI